MAPEVQSANAYSQQPVNWAIRTQSRRAVLIPALFMALMLITVGYTAYSLESLRLQASTMAVVSSTKALRAQYVAQVFLTSHGAHTTDYRILLLNLKRSVDALLHGKSVHNVIITEPVRVLSPPTPEIRQELRRKQDLYDDLERATYRLLPLSPESPDYPQAIHQLSIVMEQLEDPKGDLLKLYFSAGQQRLSNILLMGILLIMLTGGAGLALTIQQYLASRLLARNEDRVQQIFDAPPVGKLLEDTSGKWLRVNPPLCAMLGYTEEELLRREPEGLVHPDDIRTEQHVRAKLLNGDIKTYQINKRLFHQDGHIVWTMSTSSLLRNENNQAEAVISHLLDITEHLNTLAQLQVSEVRYRTVFESALNGIILANADGIILSANPYAHNIFGYEPDELTGQCISVLMPKRYRQAHESGMKRVRETGKSRLTGKTLELSGMRKDGSEFPLELTLSMWQDSQQLINITGIIQDITERRQAEEERAALIKSNKALGEFAMVAAHDLQEPLRKIAFYTERFTPKEITPENTEVQQYTDKILASVNRMQNLIRDLLSFSEVSLQPLELSAIPLNTVVNEALLELKPDMERLGASVEVKELPIINADYSQMRQLFIQLIHNALKFCRNGVSPVIRIYGKVLIKDTLLGYADFAEIRIQDNGIGFDEKYLDRIFKVFQRLHGHNEYAGTGIGLAICRRITEQHHGSITAISQPNEGTTFIITLPVWQSNTEEIGKLQ
ncbi:MAG: histidine kinase [Vampirovibrio sp.]|jgi:PAS domain S-box-containing protein|nr:histidine kinase [Vampirovibrio sp.]